MPRLTRLKSLAIVADLAITPLQMEYRHKRGVNVMYGHGGAKWVPKEAFYSRTTSYAFNFLPRIMPDDNAAFVTSQGDPNLTNWEACILFDFDHSFNKKVVPNRGFWGDLDRY
jgi:hypothetical protein